MDQFHNAIEMLDLMIQPAFCVREGTIIKVNPAAAALQIEAGASVQPLLHTGTDEYASFNGGCLYLTLSISGHQVGASVTHIQDFDVFCIEQDADAHLQALALAARELREPLSGVLAVADRVFPAVAATDTKTQEQLSHMNRSFFQILRIVNNMSDARLYTVGTESHQEIRDISAVLQEIFNHAAQLAEHAGVTLRYAGPAESIYTLLDSHKLERMVFNILSNAIKFTPAGGTVEAALTRRGVKLYLSIQDSGSGIDETVRGSLFSRYLREPGLEDVRNGLGLGMVLIRSTAALHGGTVLIDKSENSGTRITVSLTIRQKDPSVRSPRIRIDYAGERDHGLIELSDVLPASLYNPEAVN